ncbi:MAG: hypothetical protein JWO09_666 [Bacteroidetes bacterium]|nr:hypothetical protein [Bacteroidota bacterium]
MRYIVLFLLLPLFSKAQLGNSYNYVLKDLESTNSHHETIKNDSNYCIMSIQPLNSSLGAVYYYFDYSDNICYLVVFAYPISSINTLIQLMNEKYVKEGNLLWKDYSQDVYYEIDKDDKLVFLRKYQ